MKKFYRGIALTVVVGMCWGVVGCTKSATPTKTTQKKTTSGGTKKSKGHDHKHDDHDHGAHELGPHKGTLADWGGGKYHVEFTVDHDKQEATVYILGEDEKTASPVKCEKLLLTINDPKMQIDLMPAPLDGEEEGLASRFVGKHEDLGKVQEFAGTISAEVDGTPYAGKFAEEEHGDHEHEDHDHKKTDSKKDAPKE